MAAPRTPSRTPGSVAVAIVVSLMLATPVLAATTLSPPSFRWDALVRFVAEHRIELILGFSLMIVIALLLRATAARPAPRLRLVHSVVVEAAPRGLDGLA